MIVELIFNLGEEVTPRIFAQKIALACARGGALRKGESVRANRWKYTVTDPVPFDLKGDGNSILVPNLEERFIDD